MAIKIPSLSPSSQLWLMQGDCSQKWDNLIKKITNQPFNFSVEVLMPECTATPLDLATPPSYYTAHLPLSHMIRPNIIDTYIAPGYVSALSVGTRMDTDNVFALLPTGKLIILVDKDTYEQLGLQGKTSRYDKNQRFIVELDLTAPHFKPGKPNYERVKWCLTGRLGMEADFVICWTYNDAGAEEKFLQDFLAIKHNCNSKTDSLENFPLPVILADHPHGLVEGGELMSCPIEEFHTWLGVAANDGLSLFYEGSAVDDYVSTFLPPDPHSECKHGIKTKWTGMVSTIFITNQLKKIRKYMDDNIKPSWIALNVWSFKDSPVWCASNNEFGYCQCSDNLCTVIMFRTGHYWYLAKI